MKLFFNQPHLSIAQSVQPVEVSDFSILTGLNGSGKSHLLQAIQRKAVIVDGMPSPTIVFFGPTNLAKGDEKSVNVTQRIPTSWQHFNAHKGQLKKIVEDAKNRGDSDNVKNLVRQFLAQHQQNAEAQVNSSRPTRYAGAHPHEFSVMMHLNDLMGEHMFDINYAEFYQVYPIFMESGNAPSPILDGISDIFSVYHAKKEQNDYNKFRNAQDGGTRPAVSQDEFYATNGQEPWNILNDLLGNHFKIPYRVNSPENPDGKNAPLERDDTYGFQLIHIETGIRMNFNSLSSGEKVMMALVTAMYKSSFEFSKFPEILLLDEVDAVLHPSMIRQMLDVIQNYFVGKQKMKVLMATHSPSTVAYAPEESIYIVNPSGNEPRVEKQDKQTALSILTEGVVSCVFDSNARIKIRHRMRTNRKPLLLVEGVTDAVIIEEAWKKIREQEIPFDIMEFLGASHLGKSLRNIDDIIRKETGKGGFGLFDHDEAGVSEWGGFKPEKWPEIPAENIRAKKHREHKWHVVLLPVPEQLTKQAGKKYGDKSHMEIEHLFHGFEHPEVTSHFANKETPGGGKIVIFRGDKRKFAEQVVPFLPKNAFVNFEPLFRFIEEQINLPDNVDG